MKLISAYPISTNCAAAMYSNNSNRVCFHVYNVITGNGLANTSVEVRFNFI